MNHELSTKIDQVRALAALMVFVFHYEHHIAHPFFEPLNTLNPLRLFIYHGYLGVSVFFCLSGFVFAQTYAQTTQFPLQRFYLKRVCRILPSVLVILLLYALFLSADAFSLVNTLKPILHFDIHAYPQGIAHLWSITRELQCYLLFPGLWLCMRHLGKISVIILASLSLLIELRWAIQAEVNLADFYASFGFRLWEFMLGMLISAYYRTDTAKPFTGLGLSLLFAALLSFKQDIIWQSPLAYSLVNIGGLCSSSALCALGLRFFLQQPRFLPALLTKSLAGLGKISYSFYLYHFLIISFFAEHRTYLALEPMLNFAQIFALNLCAAYIGFHLIEKPMLNLKYKLG